MEAIRVCVVRKATVPVTSGELEAADSIPPMLVLIILSDWHYTVPYPREYVEYLEEQQEQLSTGLMTMYKLLKDSNIRTVPALPENPQTQELLSALRVLRLDGRAANPFQSSSPSDVQQGGPRIRIAEMPMPAIDDAPRRISAHSPSTQSSFEHNSRSPIQQPMFMPHFGEAPFRHPTGYTSFPTSSPGFSPTPYRPFDYAQPMQQQPLLAHRTHVPHPVHPAAVAGHTFQGGGVMALQQPWRQPTNSLSPGASSPLGGLSNQPTPVDSSPPSFSGIEHGDEGSLHPPWPWPYESDLAYYANHGGITHESNIGLELETIAQRGDIAMPHDSHTF